MNEEKRQEALENIELIKELVIQTKKHVGNYGGRWICFIWGIFCLIGVAGQRLFIPEGALIGAWWMILAVIAGLATYLTTKKHLKSQPERTQRNYIRYLLQFWIPLILLGYTLAIFVALLPSLSNHYISPVILLVVSTGYLMIGFMFYKGILYMGIIGYITSIISAIYFLEYSDIILGALFGVGLIITGIVINEQWKTT
ncbi:MAG: hypothetical protein JSV17_16650 [Candidatus Aminicenantes bacterium]|nr:MAG: hypothetical protein JSV17_16650 [Candidatus Aminicenantes bacterium]